ncbi:unnamed protein product [Symbiodinium microadriaticum]|nr:unnamed protein product [Symbiodinium microadriaticum]
MLWTVDNNYRSTVRQPLQYVDGGVDEGMTARRSHCQVNLDINSFYPRAELTPLGCIWHPPPWTQRLRVGEAKNPGPHNPLLRISALNVQSLNGFLDDGRFLQGDTDIAVFTETAATTFVQQKATKVAHSAGRHLVTSKPVQKRSFVDGRDCITKGRASGAVILSKLPTRPLYTKWTCDNWDSARVVDTFVLTPVGAVYICAVYGFHQGLPDADLRNEDLLREAGQRASQVECPAILLGDLNMDIQALLAWQLLEDRGWQDAAVWQQRKDGNPPQPTFKEETRIDYILVNAKAAIALQSFDVSMQPETDHRSVSAVFDWSVLPRDVTTFRMPVDAANLGLEDEELIHAYAPSRLQRHVEEASQGSDVDAAWEAFVSAYEGAVAYAAYNKFQRSLPKHFFARGKGVFHKTPFLEPPVPTARLGEFQPTGDETNVVLRQRIRQIRRLATYAAQVEAMNKHPAGTDLWIRADIARKRTWRAILVAPGFAGSFQKWWMEQHRDEFPLGFPCSGVARVMLECLKNDEPHWRQVARTFRAQQTSQVFHDDWKNGGSRHYKAIKPPGMPRVDSLDIPSSHQVQLCRARGKKTSVFVPTHDDLQCFQIGSRWSQGSATATVAKIAQGKVFLSGVVGTFKSGYILQHRPSAIPQEITQVASEYWRAYWNNKKHADALDADVVNAVQALPDLPQMEVEIDNQDLQWALSKLCTKKARGMDGFSNYELKTMPLCLRPSLVKLLNMFTNTGCWPDALLQARMALLHKTTTIGDVATTRPITILTSVYRLWAKIITRKMLSHVLPHLPKTLFGSVPGRCSGDMVAMVQTRLEKALLTGQTLHGVSLDFSKAYNTLPRELLELINKKLGLSRLWRPYVSFLSGLQRHFTCGKHWGEPQTSQVGVPEGCPIAVGQMILLTWVFTLAMETESSTVLYSYVDDWVLLHPDPEHLTRAIMKMKTLADKFGLILSLAKSGVFATDHKKAKQLQGCLAHQGISIGLGKNFKGLGVNFQTAKQLSAQLRDERWQKAKILMNRLQYMPWTQLVKTQIIVRGILPLVFFGGQTWMAGKDFMREVRAKCNHTVWGKQQYHLHYLAPLFSGQTYEPVRYLAGYRFSSFLRNLARDPDTVKEVWNLAVHNKAYFKKQTRGTISMLQHQLHDLGWKLLMDGTCESVGGWSFKIWDISAAQFQQVVQDDWEHGLLQHLRTKQNLENIETFSAFRSQFPPVPDPLLEGFMRKVRLGGLFPQKRRSHVTGSDDQTCRHCGCVDTMRHRVYECPATYSIRQTLEWNEVSFQPDSILLSGLFPRLPGYEEYLQQLDRLECPTVTNLPVSTPRFSLFTDGSAICNNCPFTRLCGWAVTCTHDAGPQNTTLTAGILPGRRQTVFRAEFQAVNTAIALVHAADIYTDNLAVSRIVAHLILHGYSSERWMAHHDRDLIVTCSRLLQRWLQEEEEAKHRYAAENALAIAWEAVPAGLRGYFPYDVQGFCNACCRLREEASYAAHEGSWIICTNPQRLAVLKNEWLDQKPAACAYVRTAVEHLMPYHTILGAHMHWIDEADKHPVPASFTATLDAGTPKP